MTGPLPPRAIPTTLYDSLMARLDRFAPVKEVAQIGAAFGREFSYQLLAAVVDIATGELDLALSQLVASELVFQRGAPPEAMYSFKHALVQDTAYQSLLRSKRHQLHSKIARMMEERFPEIADAQPELLAHHFTEAGLASQAIVYRQRAGERDLRQSAYAEAISHLKQGLEVLETLPDRPERARQELNLRLTLGSALTATQGYAGPQVGEAYLRARDLCRELGEAPPQLFPALHGLYRFYHVRGDLHAARATGEQLLKLAVSVQDSALFVEANRAFGVSNVLAGGRDRGAGEFWSEAPGSTKRRSIARTRSCSAMTREWCACPMPRWHCGISAMRSRVSTEAVRPSRWRGICLTTTASR